MQVLLDHIMAGLRCVADGYMGSPSSSLFASPVFPPVAVYEMRWYVLRRLVGIISRVVCVLSNFVTDIRSDFPVYYNAINSVLLR